MRCDDGIETVRRGWRRRWSGLFLASFFWFLGENRRRHSACKKVTCTMMSHTQSHVGISSFSKNWSFLPKFGHSAYGRNQYLLSLGTGECTSQRTSQELPTPQPTMVPAIPNSIISSRAIRYHLPTSPNHDGGVDDACTMRMTCRNTLK